MNNASSSVRKDVAVKLSYTVPIEFSEQPQTVTLQFSFIHSMSIPPELGLEVEVYYKPAEQWILLASSIGGTINFDDEKCLSFDGAIYKDADNYCNQNKPYTRFLHEMGVKTLGMKFHDNISIKLVSPQPICYNSSIKIPLSVYYYNVFRTIYHEPFGVIAQWTFME